MKRVFWAMLLMMMVMLPFSARAMGEAKPSETTTLSNTFSTVKEAGAYMRAQMKQRATTITFSYNGALSDTLHSEILNEAFAHTGVPTEGDYLRRHYKNNPTYSQSTNGNVRTYTYTLSCYTTSAQEAEVDAKLAEIFAALKLDGKSDYERARLIYDYICDHVTYDSANLYTSGYYLKYTAYSALIFGKATCGGFAVTLYRMLLEAGIDCRTIKGYGGGGDHGWNIVRMGDLYYDTDATWDRGSRRYRYFLRSEFIDHRRDAEFRTPEFYAAYPMAATDYNPTEHDPTDHTCGRNATWTLKDGVLTISCSGSMTNYFNQDAMPWRDNCASITRVVIEAGITSIGAAAFYQCAALAGDLHLGNVTGIKKYTFYGCKSLNSVSFLHCSGEIGNSAFFACDSLTSVTGLGDMFFSEENLDFYSGVTSIGKSAFRYCSNLVSLDLGFDLTSIGTSAFDGCGKLNRIGYSLSSVTHIGAGAFYECASLQDVFGGFGTVDGIGQNAFYGCNSLTTVEFSGCNGAIGSGAFYKCRNLTEVSGLDGVTSIGRLAFYRCDVLTSFDPGSNLVSIGEYAFYECRSLTRMDFSECLTAIGDFAFSRCNALDIICFTGSAPTIGASAFNQVTATAWYPQNDASWTEAVRANYGGHLTWLIDAPAVWGEPVYQWSEDHTSVTATRTDTVNASRVETETVGATFSLSRAPTQSNKGQTLYVSEGFANKAFAQQKLTVEDIPALKDMRVLRLPAKLTTIGAEAFLGADCEAIIVPDGVTAIGARAFADCARLIYIRIPASAVDVAEDALAGCAGVRIERLK